MKTCTPFFLHTLLPVLCCTLGLLFAFIQPVRANDDTFTDSNKMCTMKITKQGDGEEKKKEPASYLVGIICEQRKVLSYWVCTQPEHGTFSPFECLEKETQYVDPVKGAQKQSKDREMRIYAPDIQRVPYVLCGRLCDPSR